MDPAFENAGKQPGLQAWRVRDLKLESVPSKDLNKLYTGDSYIFLRTEERHSKHTWNIHFWIGKETSTDEAAVAAIKSVELDEILGGSPIQHRECQGHESTLFLSYFDKMGPLIYRTGGAASALNCVDASEKAKRMEKRLYRVKGKHMARVSQLPMRNTSISSNDVFVLDAYDKLFLYNGKAANRTEKSKGLEFLLGLRNDERGGRCEIILIDDDPKNVEFWDLLGGYIDVKDSDAEISDESYVKLANMNNKVLRLCTEFSEEEIDFPKIDDITPATGIFTRDLLESKCIYILDVVTTLFVWIGKDAAQGQRKNAMQIATTYLENESRPLSTSVTRVVEGAENMQFKCLFKAWNAPLELEFGTKQVKCTDGNVSKQIDIDALVKQSYMKQHTLDTDELDVSDNGSSKLRIWRIENMKKVEIPKEDYGIFYIGDSYVILYTASDTIGKCEGPNQIIYFWQGRQSSVEEKAASAIQTIALDDELHGAPVQIRIVQGKETMQFLSLFRGNMILRLGGKSNGISELSEKETASSTVSLFHVRGTHKLNTMAAEVDISTCSLHSGDCFLLDSPQEMYVWQGSGSSEDELKTAFKLADRLKGERSIISIKEEEEPDAFWDLLGGKKPYAATKFAIQCPQPPRLFHAYNTYGNFDVEEILDFSQNDLLVEDVYILDTFTSLYVWIGKLANNMETKDSFIMAEEYLARVQRDGRAQDTPIITVSCGYEPDFFTCHFLGWDHDYLKCQEFIDPYEAKLKNLDLQRSKANEQPQINSNSSKDPVISATPPDTASSGDEQKKTYTYEELLSGVDHIDITARESYLSDSEFQQIFKMTKSDYEKLPKWKQKDKKKEVRLF